MTPPFLFTSDLPAKGFKGLFAEVFKDSQCLSEFRCCTSQSLPGSKSMLTLGYPGPHWESRLFPGVCSRKPWRPPLVSSCRLFSGCFVLSGGVFELAYSSIQENRCIVSWFSFPSLPILCFQTLHLVVNKMVLLSKEIKT